MNAVRASIDLRGAQLDELKQMMVQPARGERSFQRHHGVDAFRCGFARIFDTRRHFDLLPASDAVKTRFEDPL